MTEAVDAYERFAQAVARLGECLHKWRNDLRALTPEPPRTRPPTRSGRQQPQPRTPHFALAANARPVHRQRTARGARAYASRRR